MKPALERGTTPTQPFYAPRPLDQTTAVPLDPQADLSVLDEAKILAAPSDPVLWPRWREQLRRWREEARERLAYSGECYEHSPAAIFAIPTAFSNIAGVSTPVFVL